MEIKVGHNKVFAVIILACAGFILFVSFLIGPSLNLIVGFLNLFIGIQMLAKPFLVIGEREIQLKNLFGMTLRRFHYSSPSDLEMDGSILYVNHNGERRKVSRISSFLHHAPDVQRLKDFISGTKV